MTEEPLEIVITAVGFSHPPTVRPVQREQDEAAPVEWHKADCAAPSGDCRSCANQEG